MRKRWWPYSGQGRGWDSRQSLGNPDSQIPLKSASKADFLSDGCLGALSLVCSAVLFGAKEPHVLAFRLEGKRLSISCRHSKRAELSKWRQLTQLCSGSPHEEHCEPLGTSADSCSAPQSEQRKTLRFGAPRPRPRGPSRSGRSEDILWEDRSLDSSSWYPRCRYFALIPGFPRMPSPG